MRSAAKHSQSGVDLFMKLILEERYQESISMASAACIVTDHAKPKNSGHFAAFCRLKSDIYFLFIFDQVRWDCILHLKKVDLLLRAGTIDRLLADFLTIDLQFKFPAHWFV